MNQNQNARFAVINGAVWNFQFKNWLRFLHFFAVGGHNPDSFGDRVCRVDASFDQITDPQAFAIRLLDDESKNASTAGMRKAATEVAALTRRDFEDDNEVI